MPQRPPTLNDHDNDRGFWGHLWREALISLSLGWDLAVPIFGGVLIGYALDQWLETGHVFTIGLLFLGVFVGYFNLARFIRRLEKRDKEEEEQRKK